MDEVQVLRVEIDETDAQIVQLLERRLRACRALGRVKASRGLPVLDAARECEVLARNRARLEDAENASACDALFECLMRQSRLKQTEDRANHNTEG